MNFIHSRMNVDLLSLQNTLNSGKKTSKLNWVQQKKAFLCIEKETAVDVLKGKALLRFQFQFACHLIKWQFPLDIHSTFFTNDDMDLSIWRRFFSPSQSLTKGLEKFAKGAFFFSTLLTSDRDGNPFFHCYTILKRPLSLFQFLLEKDFF